MYETVSGSARSLDPSTGEVWRKEELLKIIEGYEPQNIYNADETGLFFMLPRNMQWWKEFQECQCQECNVNGIDLLPPSVIGKSEELIALNMSESCPQNMEQT